MKSSRNIVLACISAAAIVVGLGACAPSAADGESSGEIVRGGTITVGSSTPAVEPDPVTMRGSGEINVVQPVVEYLLYVENDGTLTPQLAEDFTASEDGQTWTIKLREGVLFHDGSELTATDVVATFDRILEDDSLSGAKSTFSGILSQGGATATSDYEVQFSLDQPFAEFGNLISSGNVATGILKADYAGDFIANPIGTGPFVLESYTPDSNAKYTRFDEYWNADEVYLDGVNLQFFADSGASAAALLTRSIDLLYSASYLNDAPLFNSDQVEMLSATVSGGVFFQMRNDVAPWDDKRVRQALAHAVNRPEHAQLLVGDPTAIGNDGIWTEQFAEDVKVAPREHDIAEAKQLLEEAGYPDGLDVVLTVPTETTAVAELLQSQISEAGFRVSLEVMDSDTYYGDPWLNVPFGVSVWGTRPSVSQLISLLYKSDSDWNTSHWSNAEFDELATELATTVEPAERSRIAQSMDELLYEEVPLVRAVNNTSNQVLLKDVEGYKASPNLHVNLVGVWLDR